MKPNGTLAHDERFAQVPIAHLRVAPEFLLAARRVLPGRHAEKTANKRGPAKLDVS